MPSEAPISHTVDRLTHRKIEGWAIDPLARPIEVEVFADGNLLTRATVDKARPDVAAALPDDPNSLHSGFEASFDLQPGHHKVDVFLVAGTQRDLILTKTLHGIDVKAVDAVNEYHGLMNRPFPSSAIRAVDILLRTDIGDLTTEASQMELADKLIWLSKTEEISLLPAVIKYFRYLRETWAHCQFADRYFPQRDAKRSELDKDASCKQSTSAEMMAIIHQLYLLREEGVRGAYAEFGCFKGFSTSKLSFACSWLKIPMLVFDSFEGLPATDGNFYQRGDFAGSLEEVSGNVRQFGSPECVTYHKGIFAESLGRVEVPPLIGLFMDVDLKSSAQDLMKALDKVDPRGMIFSHECAPGHFDDGHVRRGNGGGDVVSPIVDSFAARGVPLRGRYVDGNTGAFWADQTAVPIAFVSAVMHLASKV